MRRLSIYNTWEIKDKGKDTWERRGSHGKETEKEDGGTSRCILDNITKTNER